MCDAEQSVSKKNDFDNIDVRFDKLWSNFFPTLEFMSKITCLKPFQDTYYLLGILCHCVLQCLSLITTTLWIQNKRNEIGIFSSSMIEAIFQLFATVGLLCAYLYIIAHKKKMMFMMAQMWYKCTEDIKKFILEIASKGYYLTTVQTIFLVILCIGYGSAPVATPYLLTLTNSGNKTFKKALPLHEEFLVDEDKYFFIIFIIEFISLADYGIIAGAMCFICCTFLVGIIGGVRGLEHLLKEIDAEYSYKISMSDQSANKWVHLQLKKFIRYHQTVIDFYEFVDGLARPILFAILFILSSCMILTTSSMVIAIHTDLAATGRMFVTTCGFIVVIFLLCFPCQIVTNASDDLFLTSCKLNYEIYPPKIRKTLLFIMIRTEKSFALTAGPLVKLNFETCSSIIKSCFSYAAAFKSVYALQ